MSLTIAAAALVLLLRSGPDVPFLRTLRSVLVESPAARLLAMRRHHLVAGLILVALILSGSEIVLLLGPEFLLVYAANAALYFDAMAISALVAAAGSVRQVARLIRRPSLLRIHGSRRKAARRERKSRRSSAAATANDDDPATDLALLAA